MAAFSVDLTRSALEARRHGVILHSVGDTRLDAERVEIGGRWRTNFSTCSYLGLHAHPAAIAGSIDAAAKWGTQYSSSVAVSHVALYEELEQLLVEMYGRPCFVVPSTTYAHMTYFSAFVRPQDVIMLDAAVHTSVRFASMMCRGNGTAVLGVDLAKPDEALRKIDAAAAKHPGATVYVCADGVYSMRGSCVAVDLVHAIAQMPRTVAYIDDAHGMSLDGPRGQGIFWTAYSAAHGSPGESVVVASSMSKGFGSSGGFLVLGSAEQRRLLATAPSPIMFGGPLVPAVLGACVAVARLHVSGEVVALQLRLRANVKLAVTALQARGVRLLSVPEHHRSPILYVVVGDTTQTFLAVRAMLDAGVFVMAVAYPVVPHELAGVRITITARHTRDDIERMVECAALHLLPRVATCDSVTVSVAVAIRASAPRSKL